MFKTGSIYTHRLMKDVCFMVNWELGSGLEGDFCGVNWFLRNGRWLVEDEDTILVKDYKGWYKYVR